MVYPYECGMLDIHIIINYIQKSMYSQYLPGIFFINHLKMSMFFLEISMVYPYECGMLDISYHRNIFCVMIGIVKLAWR